MRTYVLLIPVLLAALPVTASAQEGPRRGAPVPARAVREAAEAQRAFVRQPARARAARTAAEAIPLSPPKRPRGS